jgi:hypothetical protein
MENQSLSQENDLQTPQQPITPVKSKKIWLIVGLVIFVLILIATGAFFYFRYYNLDDCGDCLINDIIKSDPAAEYNNNETIEKFSLSTQAKDLLTENNFVVVPWGDREDFVGAYKSINDREVPVFVTSDSLLHLYHIQFDETLKEVEENQFYDDIWTISKKMVDEMQDLYLNTENEQVKEAANRNQTYFSVVLSLLSPSEDQLNTVKKTDTTSLFGLSEVKKNNTFTQEEFDKYQYEVPAYIKDKVEMEVAIIEKHQGFAPSVLFSYDEDFSQYTPRGHYTRSEKLKNYFQALMYMGRMTFLLNEGIVQDPENIKQTTQALLIADQLHENQDLENKWQRMYEITSYYVGISDDLSPVDYFDSINTVFNGTVDYNVVNTDQINQLRENLNNMKSPSILSGAGACGVEVDPVSGEVVNSAEKCYDSAKGLRFMGQRFVPDSYLMEQLTGTNDELGSYQGDLSSLPFSGAYSTRDQVVAQKGYPTGLEVMAVFGSQRARDIVAQNRDNQYEDYDKVFDTLKSEVDAFSEEDWTQNAYWGWIHSLRSLNREYDESFPVFMRTSAWQDKQLQATLASWSELRHDTILYVKQSYMMLGATSSNDFTPPPPPKPPVGYVEPVPEFYSRLLALTKDSKTMLSGYDVLSSTAQKRLDRLEEIINKLLDISNQELANQELSEDDYQFIKYFGTRLESAVKGVDDIGLKSTMVADVHTYANDITGEFQVLEEGVGYVNLMLVSYELPDGRTLVGAGPVFSYYEFKQPMSNRLTDEQWRTMLRSGDRQSRPEWVSSFFLDKE